MIPIGELAKHLKMLTGMDFTLQRGCLNAPIRMTDTQYHLLDKVCGKTGLRLIIGDPSHIAVDDIQDRAVAKVAALAAEEPARLKRLEAGKADLELLSRMQFTFDPSHKMLVAHVVEESTGSFELVTMDRTKLVERSLIMREGGNRVVILDVDSQKLKQDADRERLKSNRPASGATQPKPRDERNGGSVPGKG